MPHLRFFAGKGGVGKTTCAAASAVALAEKGSRILVISTDPAHSLGDALGVTLSAVPRRVPTRRGSLHAVHLDADAALERWLAPRRAALEEAASRGTYLDDEDLERIFRLSLPGVDELLGLVEVTRLARAAAYDEVVIDSAPTGHTLRLLEMPETLRRIAAVFDDMAAKHRVLSESLGGRHRRDRTDEVIEEIDGEGRALHDLLRTAEKADFVWVMLAEDLSLAEAEDGIGTLAAAGMTVKELLINRITRDPGEPCALHHGRMREERRVIGATLRAFPALPMRLVPAEQQEPRDLPGLRAVARAFATKDRGESLLSPKLPRARPRRELPKPRGAPLAESLLSPGMSLVLFGGKGGVGKTTCAAAATLAYAHAHPRARILLLSIDPAHSLGDALAMPIGDQERVVPSAPRGLRVRELDAERAFEKQRERYAAAVDALFDRLRGSSRFDAVHDRAVVQDLVELSPPGLDELFALLSVIDALVPPKGKAARFDLVVLDTAPTGHALRLLALPAAALEWVHALLAILLKYKSAVGLGDLARDLLQVAREIKALSAILHDPARSRFVTVTRAAMLPLLETERLQLELSRMDIASPFVLVNARTGGACASCRRARKREDEALGAQDGVTYATLQAPALAAPPRGAPELRAFAATWEPRSS